MLVVKLNMIFISNWKRKKNKQKHIRAGCSLEIDAELRFDV